MLTDDQVITTVEGAFRPYQCRAEVWDYGAKLRFVVLGETGDVIARMDAVPMDEARDPGQLEQIIEGVKSVKGLG